MTTEPEPLLTTDQVAAWLQVPADTVRWWRKRGRGPRFVPLGRHVRYRPADVEAYLEAQAS